MSSWQCSPLVVYEMRLVKAELDGKQAWGAGIEVGLFTVVAGLLSRMCFCWGPLVRQDGLLSCWPGDVVVLCLLFLV